MSDDEKKENLISHFSSITGADHARGKFYLESTNWEIQPAIDNFFASDHEELEQDSQPSHSSASSSYAKPKKEAGGFRSMRDIIGRKDDEDEDKHGQKFFAGGSKHSGQMISGPPKKKADPKSMAQDVFDAGKKQGAKTLEEEEKERRQTNSKSFKGTGYRLGETEEDTVTIHGEEIKPTNNQVRQTLVFWKNGFVVDSGPLRDGSSDADRAFIESISRGEIPQELVAKARGSEVDLNVEDRREEDYSPPKMVVKAFTGDGHKLGNPVPDIEPSNKHQTAVASAVMAAVSLDESQPVTTLQIRLAHGSRLTQKFNHCHSIRDVRDFIDSSSPSGSPYVLMTTFPNKELTDDGQTLAEAKLLNAVIVQRFR
eukprot:m.308695 g.308695  ORF g.308695 m.308695 type:complete len:370 (+) comp44524_c0_seq1:28-1137(+)